MDSSDWIPVATFVLGLAAAQVQDWIRDKRARTRERQARRDDFQRETLLNLQEALHDLARAQSKVYSYDLKTFREAQGSVAWNSILLPPEIDELAGNCQRRTSVLIQRVASDSLRETVRAMKERAAAVSLATSEEEGLSALRTMSGLFETANDQIGVLLREVH